MKEWSRSSKRMLDSLLRRVCDHRENEHVIAVLELGADPFLEDEQGMTAVTKAALSNIEPREKISSIKSSYADKVKKQLYNTVSFDSMSCKLGT